jgi:hypothetical protein
MKDWRKYKRPQAESVVFVARYEPETCHILRRNVGHLTTMSIGCREEYSYPRSRKWRKVRGSCENWSWLICTAHIILFRCLKGICWQKHSKRVRNEKLARLSVKPEEKGIVKVDHLTLITCKWKGCFCLRTEPGCGYSGNCSGSYGCVNNWCFGLVSVYEVINYTAALSWLWILLEARLWQSVEIGLETFLALRFGYSSVLQ